MSYYRLSQDGWVPHTSDSDGYRKYYAAQVKGLSTSNTFPIKDTVKHDKKRKQVKVQLVSAVQDAVNRAKADLKRIKGDTRNKKINRPRAVKAAASNKSVDKYKHSVKSHSVKSNSVKRRASKHKKPVRAALKKALNDKKSFASQFVHRSQPQDVWGPAKW
jgi:capsule polysaccharide export protein KpsE/RkpR